MKKLIPYQELSIAKEDWQSARWRLVVDMVNERMPEPSQDNLTIEAYAIQSAVRNGYQKCLKMIDEIVSMQPDNSGQQHSYADMT